MSSRAIGAIVGLAFARKNAASVDLFGRFTRVEYNEVATGQVDLEADDLWHLVVDGKQEYRALHDKQRQFVWTCGWDRGNEKDFDEG